MKLFRVAFSILLLLFLTVPTIQAQERIAREAFYNSSEGFHILIPAEGWENQSTEAYAHFYEPDAQVSIYAISVPTTDVQAGIEQAIGRILPDFEAEPIISEVILSNGTWTQNLYLPAGENGGRVTAYGQVYAGNTYVILWHTTAIITLEQPVIVPGEDVQAGIAVALDLLGEAPEDILSTNELTANEETWVQNYYDSTPSVPVSFSVLARVRGENTLVFANITGRTPVVAPFVFFTMLTDFFITPATTPYLYLGLAAVVVIALAFIGSLIIRQRNLEKDLQTLETLQAEG